MKKLIKLLDLIFIRTRVINSSDIYDHTTSINPQGKLIFQASSGYTGEIVGACEWSKSINKEQGVLQQHIVVDALVVPLLKTSL